MFENFIVTDHIIERYQQRVKVPKKEVMKRIKKDLHFSKVKQIVNKGNVRHVFTHHSKEFIFVKDHNRWILKTVIKRSRNNNPQAITKRKKVAYA